MVRPGTLIAKLLEGEGGSLKGGSCLKAGSVASGIACSAVPAGRRCQSFFPSPARLAATAVRRAHLFQETSV